jgi:hypothetical protein
VPKPDRDRVNPKKQKSNSIVSLKRQFFGIWFLEFGILIERAEIIPSEPDPVSTGEGKVLSGCKLLPHWLIV